MVNSKNRVLGKLLDRSNDLYTDDDYTYPSEPDVFLETFKKDNILKSTISS